tara:strand:- start:71 stop:1951 length:1881 start_codon:yes stop_codon:yes gene_type:complete
MKEKNMSEYKNLDKIAPEMTVKKLMVHYNKTQRGVKTTLTVRGIDCLDYLGSLNHGKNKRTITEIKSVLRTFDKNNLDKKDYSNITKQSLPMSIKELNSTTALNVLFGGLTQYQKSNVIYYLAAHCRFNVVIAVPMLEKFVQTAYDRLTAITQDPANPFKVMIYNARKMSNTKITQELAENRCIFIVGVSTSRLEKSALHSAVAARKEDDFLFIRDESDMFAEHLIDDKDYAGRDRALMALGAYFSRKIHVTATPIALFLRQEEIPDVMLLREPPFYVGYKDYTFKSLPTIDIENYVEIIDAVYPSFARGKDNLFIYNQKTDTIHDHQTRAILNKYVDDIAVITVGHKDGIRVHYDDQVDNFTDIQEASTFAYQKKDIVVYLAGQMLGRQQSVVDEAGRYPVRIIAYTAKSISNGSSVIHLCGRASGSYEDRVNTNTPIVYTATEEMAKEILKQHQDSDRIAQEMYTNFPNGGSDAEKARYIAGFIFEARDTPVLKRMMNGYSKSPHYSQKEIDAAPFITKWIPAKEIHSNYSYMPKSDVENILREKYKVVEKVYNYRSPYKEPEKVSVLWENAGKYQLFDTGIRIISTNDVSNSYKYHSHLGTERIKLSSNISSDGFKLITKQAA